MIKLNKNSETYKTHLKINIEHDGRGFFGMLKIK